MLVPLLVVYVRHYLRIRFGRCEHVSAHTRSWPKR